MPYLITLIVLITGLIAYLINDRNRPKLTYEQKSSRTGHQEDNPYEGLRNLALAMMPAQLNLNLSSGETMVYGVVMDWGLDIGIATIVAYQTGDASFYLSSGGGVIGGAQHEKVSIAAKQFVNSAQAFLDKMAKAESTGLPGKNTVIFYLLTNHGLYTATSPINDFENGLSPLTGLFNDGNNVLAQLRLINNMQ